MKPRTTPRAVIESAQSMIRMLLAAAAFALLPLFGMANTAAPLAADPVLERRLMTLAGELRCLVCQNQTLAESNAELAVDLRTEIREQMQRGATDQDVIAYLVARYGDFVLYRPPLKASTLLLWSGPGLLLLAGIGFLARTLVRRRAYGVRAPLSPEAHARARKLLGAGTVEDPS
jgi:cytochrome c-type biogenesis protein CcmH